MEVGGQKPWGRRSLAPVCPPLFPLCPLPPPLLLPLQNALTLLSFPSLFLPSFVSLPLPLPSLSASVINFLGRSTVFKTDIAFLCMCVACLCACAHAGVHACGRQRALCRVFLYYLHLISFEAGSLPDPGAQDMPLTLLPRSPRVADPCHHRQLSQRCWGAELRSLDLLSSTLPANWLSVTLSIPVACHT